MLSFGSDYSSRGELSAHNGLAAHLVLIAVTTQTMSCRKSPGGRKAKSPYLRALSVAVGLGVLLLLGLGIWYLKCITQLHWLPLTHSRLEGLRSTLSPYLLLPVLLSPWSKSQKPEMVLKVSHRNWNLSSPKQAANTRNATWPSKAALGRGQPWGNSQTFLCPVVSHRPSFQRVSAFYPKARDGEQGGKLESEQTGPAGSSLGPTWICICVQSHISSAT